MNQDVQTANDYINAWYDRAWPAATPSPSPIRKAPSPPTSAQLIAGRRTWSVLLQTKSTAAAQGSRVDFTSQPNTPSTGITTVTATITGMPTARLFVVVKVSQD